MALTFGGATSDRVSIAANASINVTETSTISVLVRFKVSTFTFNRYLVAKNAVDGNGGFRVDTFTGGEMRMRMSCSVTDANVTSSSLALSTGVWYDGHFVYDDADSQEGHIYITLAGTDNWAEPTYSTNTNHSGVTAGNPALVIGNTAAASPTSSFQGGIASVHYRIGSVHTALERRLWQLGYGHIVAGAVKMELGFPGTGTQNDFSGNGNDGTLTGATYLDHPAGTQMPFHDWQVDDLPYAVAALAAGQPTIKRWGGVPFMRLGGATFGQGWGT